jgi:hypothetical protein
MRGLNGSGLLVCAIMIVIGRFRIGEMTTILGTSDTIYVKLKCQNSQCFSLQVDCNLLILPYLLVICKIRQLLAGYGLSVIGYWFWSLP